MKFREGDKVEFIYLGELKQGVVTEIRASNFDISYQVKMEFMGTLWFTENELVAPAPVVALKRFAADWLNHCKQREYDLACLLDYEDSDMSAEMTDWLCLEESNQGLLARAWLDGYEVEKEPLYYVKLIDHANGYLNVYYDNQKVVGSNEGAAGYKTQFTEAEIKSMDKGEAYWLLKELVEAEAE
ncbi:DUF1642 domain-containing protein [Listeria cossartiae subsp. cayugensis]|uniref:DUF1642 domain-containing protein n=1 Tax=Listeria cossartiae subsp. cayugensis TaxID=2713505 RepID=A0ABU2IK83_9LIST|nr:DUF1642 domain-containing protein [Listeria cossartiae]MDT0064590.1 DUF1642 domain-containing protein [Listeria cossartiae subsp. cayugensis]MDT0079806.1 DUF1642 domain-containing protein [Listeria cossartiae subsp. cayugensis]MDT0082642.1 DUF1642 domain-containing protein [Listeria cossartiae subsp. cayugensis]MDT0086823.1 DUF1642 domain-containing protein [Listeria cossartiae subsp. cayugensis]MDT0099259.1 DUF1642 domain-containing protein [Listeria cossartiae subsp. cayugensis]